MTRTLPIVVLTLLLAASAQAQSSDPTASALALKRGEKVIVTRVTIHETIRGRVVGLDEDGLEVAIGRTRQVVPLGELERVERPKDRIWDGALIGYGLGFAAGAVMVLSQPCGRPEPGAFINLCFDGPGFALAYGGVITGPIGMGIGAIGDAIRRKPRVVFDRKSPTRVAIAPTFVRGGGGLRVAVAF
jgi:hypothetical protein